MKLIAGLKACIPCLLAAALLPVLAARGSAAPQQGDDRRKMDEYLKTLNAGADELHSDITPSVLSLSKMGLVAVPSLLDLMKQGDTMTRLHAQRALELILERRHGFVPGKGLPDEAVASIRAASIRAASIREEWQANGSYDYSAPADARAASVALWRSWLAKTLAEQKY